MYVPRQTLGDLCGLLGGGLGGLRWRDLLDAVDSRLGMSGACKAARAFRRSEQLND
jgi:hypothetical protein